jgi:ElaB/YqjD/DUF883 family membrane-anchored ribosome-binding protein
MTHDVSRRPGRRIPAAAVRWTGLVDWFADEAPLWIVIPAAATIGLLLGLLIVSGILLTS